MMTPTHLLVGAAAYARPGEPVRNCSALAGAIFPDLSIFVLFFWAKAMGVSERVLWREMYWQDPWQTLGAISNSVPLLALLAVIGLWVGRSAIVVFAGAALLHVACDLPLHATDAHRHFWPITDWRFQSPVSYWDSRFHGSIARVFELCFAITLIVMLARKFRGPAVRAVLALALVSYIAVPAYFRLMLH